VSPAVPTSFPLRTIVAGNPGALTLDGTRSYAVGGESAVLIDPGPPGRPQMERLRAGLGDLNIDTICLTHAHADHSGAASAIASERGATIAASPETLHRTGLSGIPLRDGDALSVDGDDEALIALETPGHTADHLCFLLSSERFLFSGDLVLGCGTSVILHPDGQVDAYLASLTRLIGLRPRRIFPAHGEPLVDPIRRLEELRSHRLERETQIKRALETGARTVQAIRTQVYGKLDPGLKTAAAASIRAHLAHLAAIGVHLPESLGSDVQLRTNDT